MTKNIFRLALMAAALTLWGCSDNDEQQNTQPQYITITTDISEMTRIGSNNINEYFETGDEVSVYAWTGDKNVAPSTERRVVDNSINKLNSEGTWVATPQMLWKNPMEKHYFLGIHPKNDAPVNDLADVPYTFDVNDQRGSDLLVAYNNQGVLSEKKSVNLSFDHVMSKLVLNLSFNNQWGQTPDVKHAVLSNVATKGSVNYITQATTPDDNSRQDIPLPNNAPSQFVSIIMPQDGVRKVTVYVNGEEFSYTHPTDINFEKDKVLYLNLLVGRDRMTLGSMRIDNWNVGETIDGNTSGYNPAKYITNRDKLEMIYSIVDKETDRGRIYEMNYNMDYKLDDALKANITDLAGLQKFVAEKLYDKQPSNAPKMGFGAGCSAFAASESGTGNYLMGRNYDYCHLDDNGKETEIAAIVVKTTPWWKKKSVSVVDGYWIGMNKGFFGDGKTDLSMLMAAPYAFMDGINEDGFAIGVLHLQGLPTIQKDPEKPNVFMNVAMRMLLDNAADVDEAVALLNQYNMRMTSPAGGNFHFYMADAKGKYAIVEYVSENGDISENPWKIDVMTENDAYRYVTNFYVSDCMKDTPYGRNDPNARGKQRYNDMRDELTKCKFTLSMGGAAKLLDKVSQAPNPEEPTSHTQWSSIYNLSKKTLTLSLLREYNTAQPFEFKVE